MPRWPTRSSLCTEPGRSTITSRRAPAAVGVMVRWPRPAACPVAQTALGRLDHGRGFDRSGDDQVRGARTPVRGLEGAHVVQGQRSDGLGRARRQTPVGVEASNRWCRNISSARRPGSARACRMSARRSALSRSNSPRSSRGSRTISASRAIPSSRARAATGRRPRRVPAGLAADLDAQSLGGLGEGAGVQAAGAGDQQLGGQSRHPALGLVLRRRPGVDQQTHVDDGGAWNGNRPDRQPVRQRVTVEVGEVVGP